MRKTQPSFDRTRICLPFVHFMLLLITSIHMDISVKNSLVKVPSNFVIGLIYFCGSLFSFMFVLNAKRTNIFLNRILFLLAFYENATQFIYRISMDFEVSFPPSSQGISFIFVITDTFSLVTL